MASSGIHSAKYQRDRALKKAEWKRKKRPCNICGMPIDYELPRDHLDHFQLDHIKARSTHPELEFDPLNWVPTHASCNRPKSNNAASPGIGVTSYTY